MLVVAGALLLTLVAGVAVARTYTCDDNNCPGTNNDDEITGDGSGQTFRLMEGDDFGSGKGGADALYGDGGDDELRGGRGADVLRADDGDEFDFGTCGRGDDTLYVDSRSERRAFSNCEDVNVV